jgi:hypothetical protein
MEMLSRRDTDYLKQYSSRWAIYLQSISSTFAEGSNKRKAYFYPNQTQWRIWNNESEIQDKLEPLIADINMSLESELSLYIMLPLQYLKPPL